MELSLDNVEQRIISCPDILRGKPIVRGTRIPVYLILDLVAAGMSDAEIVDDYPDLTEADVRAAVAFASSNPEQASVAIRSASACRCAGKNKDLSTP